MKQITKITLFIMMISALAIFCGCAPSSYSYSVVSSDVYLAGDYMRGPAPRAIDIELTLSNKTAKDGTEVYFDYFGTRYHGTVKSNRIQWDSTPVIIGEGTITKSTIEPYNSGIKIIHTYKMNNYSLTGEIIQVFSPK